MLKQLLDLSPHRLRRERKAKPISPGEILLEEFLKPMGLTEQEFADHINCDVSTINLLIKGQTNITVPLALKFGAAFNMSPESWLQLQYNLDFYEAMQTQDNLPAPLIAKPEIVDE